MTYAVNAAVAQVEAPPIAEAMTWVRKGERNRALLNLCQAVPGYPAALALREEVARAALRPETGLYTDILGLPSLREALAAHMAWDYKGAVAPANVAITAGCNQAFCTTLMALAGAGDNIILPAPCYFNHQMWADMLGIETRHIPAFCAEGPWPDAAKVVIDARTRAIVLCSPNNPTGSIYPPEVIAAFYELAASRGVALVIDETYKDFRPTPAPLHDLFARSGWQETFIQLYSFSKIFAMTGYRVGSIIAGEKLMGEIEKVQDTVAICAPQISQTAALFGLQNLEAWKGEKKAIMLARIESLRTAFKHPDLRYELISAGAYFAYVRHPFAGSSASDVAKRLASQHDLLCLPGSIFGPNQEDYLRIAFANVEANIMPPVVERLIESQ